MRLTFDQRRSIEQEIKKLENLNAKEGAWANSARHVTNDPGTRYANYGGNLASNPPSTWDAMELEREIARREAKIREMKWKLGM